MKGDYRISIIGLIMVNQIFIGLVDIFIQKHFYHPYCKIIQG
jgi:hypothetical protein